MTTSGYQLELADANGATLLELLENSLGGYRLDTLAADATFGNPVPVSEAISSLMSDGSLTSLVSFGNRTAVFDVTITADGPDGLASGEQALMSALDQVAALVWRVPLSAPSHFDVVACWSEHQLDDLDEVRQTRRTFRLTFECLPFARSASLTTINWTGPTELAPLTSLTGWTTVSGSATVSGGLRTTSTWRARRTFAVDDYLWFKVTRSSPAAPDQAITNVTINGTAVPDAQVHHQGFGVQDTTQFYTVPVGAWRGQSVSVEFTLSAASATAATLTEFWTRAYPGAAVDQNDSRPKGIDVIDIIGTARTPCTLSFTAPSGGAFVYTGPDPNAAIRSKGAAEAVFGKFTVSDPDGAEVSVGSQVMWFPPGDHTTNVGITAPQPLELSPNGVWPSQASGGPVVLGDDSSASQWAYPVDAKAAISFFSTTGAKNLISASPALPQGYHGDAVAHEEHSLFPGRSGFAVLNVNGDPIAATVTYFPRWKHHAAQ